MPAPQPPLSQIPLDLAPTPDFSLERFEVGLFNQAAFNQVTTWPNWPSPILILVGPEGVGKTHLGTAWAKSTGGRVESGQGFTEFKNPQKDETLFLDAAQSADEQALFTLLNLALNGHIAGLLLAARQAPQQWDITIPDLRSRLTNTPVVDLGEHDDEILESIVRKLFEDQGRAVSADVVRYLLYHEDRSVANLRLRVAELDFSARQAKKDMTKRFVSAFLKTV